MSKKRFLALLLAVFMMLTLIPPSALANSAEAGPVFEEPVVASAPAGVSYAAFSGRVDELALPVGQIPNSEWPGVDHAAYTAGNLTLRVTASDRMLYTIVEDSRGFGRGTTAADRDTRNVFYISIDGVEGYTFMGRPNVSYVVANGYLYRVLNAMAQYRAEYAAPAQIGPTSAENQRRVWTEMPEWFGADDDPSRDAERLGRIGMEYFRDWTGMRLSLDQIGNPDPADVSISWRGMTGGVQGNTETARQGVAVHLPTDTATLLSAATFERYRPDGVYFPAEDFNTIFNPLRGGGANLQSSEAPVHTCADPENCPATWIHTTVCRETGDRIPFSETDGPLDGQFYGYAYISWRSVEPEYGVFDWDNVRMYTKGDYPVVGPDMDQYQCVRGNLVTQALQAYADIGAYVQLRFVMDYPFGSPFGYWYGDNYKGGIYNNSPLGGQESHTDLAMINLRNERIADIPTWLIERMREEPNQPNFFPGTTVSRCPHNIPVVPDFDPSVPGAPVYIPGDNLYQRMRDENDSNAAFFSRFNTDYFHCTIPNPAGGADLRVCDNGCIPYRRPAGLRAYPITGTGGAQVEQRARGWNPDNAWGPEGTWYLTPPPDISGGVGLGPRYAHHLMLDYHQRAINALAAEIAREGSVWNAVANVQLGSLGRWGEWHNWPAGDTGTFPQGVVAYPFVRHYVDAFACNPNVQIGMRYPNWLIGRYNFGQFNDQTGHANNLNYAGAMRGQNLAGNNDASRTLLGGWMGTGITSTSSGNDGANMGNATFAGVTNWGNSHRHPTWWRYNWTGGEYGDVSCPTNWGWQYVQFDVGLMGDLHRGAMHDYGRDSTGWGNANGHTRVHIMNTIDSFRWTHVSNLAPRGPNAGRTNAITGDMQRAHKNNDAAYDNMGYRFTIEEVEVMGDLVRGEDVDVRMVVNNRGVAPFYRNWPFEVSFIDSDGNVAATEIIEDIDIREWMPRHRAYNNARPAMTTYREFESSVTGELTRVYYRTGAELSVLGNVSIPAHDGRNEMEFTVTIPEELSLRGDYTLAVAILDPILLQGEPGIRFHNLPQREDRRVVLAPFVVEGSPQEYFVATNGVDNLETHDGSKAHPWATVAFAMTQMYGGDTLNIRAGMYSEAITVPVRLGGNSVMAPCENEFNFLTGGCLDCADLRFPHEDRGGVSYCTLNELGNTVFRAYPGDDGPVIFRRDQIGGNAFLFTGADNLTVEGIRFEGFGGGIRFNPTTAQRPAGGFENLYIRNNVVAYNRAGNSINIYNQNPTATNHYSLRNVVIEGNHVHDGRSGWTETVVVNGNVNGIRISDNLIHNSNNIAIDLIGWENGNNVVEAFEVNRARNILVHDNVIQGIHVINGHQTYRRPHANWGFPPGPMGNYDPCSVGIYFDSGYKGRIFNNFIFDVDIGISISSERLVGNIDQLTLPGTDIVLPNQGWAPWANLNTGGGMNNNVRPWYLTHVHVHDNIIATTSGEGAISLGGYSANRTDTFDIIVENNILFANRWDFLIQNSHGNIIRNNVIVSEQMELGYGSRQAAGRFMPWPGFPPTTAPGGGDFWNFTREPQDWPWSPRSYRELPGANRFLQNFWYADDPDFYFNGPTTFSLMTLETQGLQAAIEFGGFFERLREQAPLQYALQVRLPASPLVDPGAGNFDFTPAFRAAAPNAGTNWRPEPWALELFAESFQARIEVDEARRWLETNSFNLVSDILDEGYTTLNEFINARLYEAGFENTEILYTVNAAPQHGVGTGFNLYDGGHGTMADVRARELIVGLHAGWTTVTDFNVQADNDHAAFQVPWRADASPRIHSYIHADRVAAEATAIAMDATREYREIAYQLQVVTRFGPDCPISGKPLHYVTASTYSCRYYGMDRASVNWAGWDFTDVPPNGGLRLFITAPFVPVTSITGAPTTATAGVGLPLTATVAPAHATNRTIVWSVTGANASITDGVLTATTPGTVTVTATIADGTAVGTPFVQTFDITVQPSPFVPVTGITGAPTAATVGVGLPLAAAVAPDNATNRTIVWSVYSAGTTGATIAGNTLNTTAAGAVVVRATIADGTAAGTAFTQNFTITVTPAFVPVTGITGVPTAATVGVALPLTATVAPDNATNQTIVWTVSNAGTTGAAISGGALTATGAGTVTVTATIADGTAVGTPFTATFPITVTQAPLSADATLQSLRVVSEDDDDEVVHTLDPEFDPEDQPEDLEFAAEVPHAVTEVEIDYTAACADATVEITRPAADPEADSDVVDGPAVLAVGENVFTITVTAADGTTTQVYTVTVTRGASSDADLSGLRVVSEDADEAEVVHALDPAFSPAVLAYTVNVLHAVTEIEIDAAAVCADAAVVITRPAADPEDDPVVVDGPAALALGENVFTITVTAADGETVRVYTVTVTRGAEIEEHLAFMFGNDEGHFMPSRNATRADVAAILARVKLLEFERGIEELPTGMSAFTAFSDVDEDDWFYYYVAWAYDAGLVRGDDTGRFRPHDPITRQEFAAMLARTLDAYEEEAGQMSFRDAGTITSWATHYVYTVYSMGWMVGDDAGNFNPLFYTARADVATAMNRILGRIDSRAALDAADVENQSYARSFPDVATTAWYFPSVMAAANDHRLTRDAEDAIDWKYIIRPATP